MVIPLSEYIRKTIEEINSGLPTGYVIDDTIDFEVSVTTSTNKSGGVEIKVISGGIEKGNEIVQSVFFSVINENQKQKSLKKEGENILRYIDKGLRRLSRYSNTEDPKQINNNDK